MARLVKSVAERTSNFESIDKEYAYAIWVLEKEFHIGMVGQEFPAMKFLNLVDMDNIKRFNDDSKHGGKTDEKGFPKTFG